MTEDHLDKAKRILDRLERDEPHMRARIKIAFDEMAAAREELRLHLEAMKSEVRL